MDQALRDQPDVENVAQIAFRILYSRKPGEFVVDPTWEPGTF